MGINDITNTEAQKVLRQLFDAAAAKSLAVNCTLDAEPEMAQFLRTVKSHPEERQFVIQLFIESFSDSFYMRHEPSQFLMYCMYDLRWPEIQTFITSKRAQEVKERGAATSPIWDHILESFEDNWEAAQYFRELKHKP